MNFFDVFVIKGFTVFSENEKTLLSTGKANLNRIQFLKLKKKPNNVMVHHINERVGVSAQVTRILIFGTKHHGLIPLAICKHLGLNSNSCFQQYQPICFYWKTLI